MKFSHSLQFNAVPEWTSKYINYSGLKKVAYSLQREYADVLSQNAGNQLDVLAFTSNPNDEHNPLVVFENALDAELAKIASFYESKEEIILEEWKGVVEEYMDFIKEFPLRNEDKNTKDEVERMVRDISSDMKDVYWDDNDNEDLEGQQPNIPAPTRSNLVGSPELMSADSNLVDRMGMSAIDINERAFRLQRKRSLPTLFDDDDFHITFLEALKAEKRRLLVEVFTHLSELKSFIELNKIGFGKALKKFDKLLSTNLKTPYLEKLNQCYIFKKETTDKLNVTIEKAITLYSIFTGGRIEEAKIELRTNLREKVVFERNTVWRDMIGMERKSQAAYAKRNGSGIELQESKEPITISLGAGKTVSIPSWIFSWAIFKIFFIVLTTWTLLNFSPFEDEQQKNCFAVLICASLLWATEAVPLFVTSLFLPFLIVTFRVLKDPITGEPLNASDASKFICSAMWSPIILLLLGGFTLAAALSRYNLDKFACTSLLSKVPQTPATILFSIMVVSTIVASFVSNVAAPVLMYSVIQPVLNTLPEGSGFAQALVLGIALASNVAGMASPIASPQNVVALQFMDPQPNWIQWFAVSVPVCSACLLLIFVVLLLAFNFQGTTIIPIKAPEEKFNGKQLYVIVVTICTIILWCLASLLEPIFGDMGMISILSMFAFYAPGILSGEDFNNYPWTIVILAMGGLALGKAVTVSGLLTVLASTIQSKLYDAELFTVMTVFGMLILTMATFVSHTVAALITVPLVAEIGRELADPHPNLLVFAGAMLCSCAMGLPTSGFPNVTAIGLTDSVGNKYLTVGTFIKIGVPISLGCGMVVCTIGYLIMKLMGM
ncbi:Pho91 protein [Martiniozyma asiatica (nom. inval.)]|nr:Pho91 protein [Martiniozyma asiatica]